VRHTPEPWILTYSNHDTNITVRGTSHGPNPKPRVCTVHSNMYGSVDANASLIAAAPELLEACKTGFHEREQDGPALLHQVAMVMEGLRYTEIADALRNKADLEAEAIDKTRGCKR
jgi:hypothetical protein